MNKPYRISEKPGVKHYCACGKTKTQPHCDGSHQCTDIEPYEVFIEIPLTVAICGCGKSGNLPYCDGSHECSRPL